VVVGSGTDVDVILLVADDVSVFALRALGSRASAHRPPVVLACNRIRRTEMLYAARLGVTAVLGRDARDDDRLMATVIDAGRHSAGSDAPLSEREVRVLRLLADGFDTTTIASRVNYSERTVKQIIHGVVTRNKLRNRAHAVAYAALTGVL
jgi:DNA-binding NarL/FixJ family response regulator